ncbi:uncharacterized protein LOC123322590 isoform X1 [Coccinella septempunctata]|uniref:uncharacterized protein LOC123322590 isoform X1 n=1 Tax=Coccinella septempunctata TaxID=41139 RepID=UPI001D05CEDB|nr:uncharacterized protein LOC123322590 isoform X1 [Coccinella septempunctata]
MPTDMTTLPPGWEAKIDKKSGKTYYINHQDKTTTWDHPCKTFPKKWTSNTNGYPKNTGTEYIGLQDFSPRNRGSPLTVRPKTQESPLSSNSVNTDEAVSKIAAMFPTVSEAHIRLLMKKFHNREVLVISALQVEKNPVTTPGPFATPPPQRNIFQNLGHAPSSMTPPLGVYRAHAKGGMNHASGTNSYTNSPRIGDYCRSTSRPHSSPKLKLRYMKSIFPKAEETLILEILSNHDNNIQKSSEKLREMGFEKKDSLKISQQKYEMQIKSEEDKEEDPKSPSPIPKVLTTQEKETVKSDVQKEHQDIPEQLIQIALESVDFDREKARNLLKGITLMESKTEEGKIVECSEVDNEAVGKNDENLLPVSMSRQSLKSLLKSERVEKEKVKISRGNDSGYKSNNLSSVVGPNPALAKGNKENLLLEDYVKWLGPDRTICKGANPGLAKGPSASNKIDKRVGASGPNSDNRKGPNKSLVKGSIFSQMKATAGVAGESRGK